MTMSTMIDLNGRCDGDVAALDPSEDEIERLRAKVDALACGAILSLDSLPSEAKRRAVA